MTATAETAARRAGLLARFASFVAERHPLALRPAVTALDMATGGQPVDERNPSAIDALREPLHRILLQTLSDFLSPDASAASKLQGAVPETTPGVSVSERLHLAVAEVADGCDGFLRREAIAASLTSEEKLEILRGMILTRATDNRLKQFFTGGEVRYGAASFQGKGFRSLGQEAIYAAAIRLRRGDAYASDDGWQGDVVSPMIRDLGVVLAMHNDRSTVRMVLSAQMGKAGPPMNGKDLHVGDWDHGILPAMAPLGSPALNVAGIAMAFSMRGSGAGSRESEAASSDLLSDPRPPTPDSLPKNYILFVSTIEPRKNLDVLLDAYARLRARGAYGGALVVVGRVGWKSEAIVARLRAPGVHHLDYLPSAQLASVYRNAELFVFPSIYEGFGFPLLEAMAYGVPSIAARSSSLPEIGGDAALYFDPRDARALETQIEAVLTDPVLRKKLAEAGVAQAARFRWDVAAEKTLGVLRRCAGLA